MRKSDREQISVEVASPIELIPVLDILRLGNLPGRPQSLEDYPHLLRLDVACSTGFIQHVIEASRPGEKAGPLLGGYVLRGGDAILCAPQCCGDLGNLSDWEEALAAPAGSWSELWIGHPCLAFRREDNELLLQGYIEPGEAGTCPIPDEPVFRLPLEALATAIQAASRMCHEHVSPLAMVLRRIEYWEPHDLSAARFLGVRAI